MSIGYTIYATYDKSQNEKFAFVICPSRLNRFSIDLCKIAREFVAINISRMCYFGRYSKRKIVAICAHLHTTCPQIKTLIVGSLQFIIFIHSCITGYKGSSCFCSNCMDTYNFEGNACYHTSIHHNRLFLFAS